MKRYRRLEVGDRVTIVNIQQGRSLVYISNEVADGQTGTVIGLDESGMLQLRLNISTNDIQDELVQWIPLSCIKLLIPKPQHLIRKYRLLKDNEPIRMFDWFKIRCHHEDGLWPAPNKEYNEGWCQITPNDNGYLADNDPNAKLGFVFARFVDCVPLKKS